MSANYNYVPLTNVDKKQDMNDGCTISSPVLFDLLNGLDSDEFYQVLDVLPAKQGMLDLFAGIRCKLFFPGCLFELCNISTENYDTENKLYHVFTKTLGFYKKQKAKLNVIFLWDVLNYMDKQVVKELISYLSCHVDSKVKLHFYIHTRRQMPASPSIYSVIHGENILIEKNSEKLVDSPLYFRKSLEKLLHPYKVKRSILLSGGMQEYILEL